MAEDMQQNYINDLSMDESTDAQGSGSPVPPEISRDPEVMETDESNDNTGCKQDQNQRTEEQKSMSKVVKKKEKLRKLQSENEQLKKQISELEERQRHEMMKNKPLLQIQSENEQLKKQISELEERQRQEMMKNKPAPEETLSDRHTEGYVLVLRPNQEKENLKQPLEEHSSELQQKEEEIRKLQAKNEELERSYAALQKEANDWSSKAHYLEQSFQERYEELNTEICSLRDRETEQAKEIRSLTANNQSKTEALSSMTLQLEQLKLEIKSKDDEIKNFQEAQKIFESQTQTELRKQHQQITHLQEHNKSLNAGKMEAEKQKRLKEDIIRQLDATIRQQQDSMEYFKHQYQQDLRERNSKIESLEKEKKDLTLRLSRLAGANLTYNNPNIADLSDENRPTKLAEEFSELYDNEWTDAFEILTAEDEREKTQVMLNILKEANKLCQNATKDHTDAVRNGFITLNVPSDLEVVKMPRIQTPATALKETQNSVETTKTSAETQEVQDRDMEAEGEKTVTKTDDEETIKVDNQPEKPNDADAVEMEVDFQEHTQPSTKDLNGIGSATESADQSDLTAISNMPLPDDGELSDEENKNHHDKTTDKDQTKLERGEPSTGGSNHQTTGKKEPLCPVNDENSITNLSEDPARSKKEEQITQQNENRFFNNQFGKEENGDEHSGQGTPIACYKSLIANFDDLTNEHKKTVSDIRRFFEDKLSELFRQESTKIINKSLPENMQNEESLQKYIQKCLQLCWSMCRHEPPVFIHFIEPGSDKPFDTNTFKPYTKTGKYVDYVVWPALYLHEGGPMLSKGVAQGQK